MWLRLLSTYDSLKVVHFLYDSTGHKREHSNKQGKGYIYNLYDLTSEVAQHYFPLYCIGQRIHKVTQIRGEGTHVHLSIE